MTEIQTNPLTQQQANFLGGAVGALGFSGVQILDTQLTPLVCPPSSGLLPVVPQCIHEGATMTGAGVLAANLTFALDNQVVKKFVHDVAPLPQPLEDISSGVSMYIERHPTLDIAIRFLRPIVIGMGAELVVRLGQMGVHETLASARSGDLLTDVGIGFAALTLTNLGLRSIEPIKKILQSPKLHAATSKALDVMASVGNKTIVPLVVNTTKPKLKNRDRDSE